MNMENKRGKIIRVLLIFIVIVGGYLAINFVPTETLSKLNIKNINYSIIIFVIQWIIIMIIIIYTYIRYITTKSKEKKKVAFSQKIIKKKDSQTDFDVLYNLLKQEKSLSTKTVATIFKIKKDIALEWAKILESNDLATVEYPAFGDPEVILKNKEDKNMKNIPEIQKKVKKVPEIQKKVKKDRKKITHKNTEKKKNRIKK
jgi:hypothetical protein